MDKLNLNIGGAQADLAAMNASRNGIEQSVTGLAGVSSNLYGGVMEGAGAATGSDLYGMLSKGLTSTNEVVTMCNQVVGEAASTTEGYDRGGACGAIGGR